eukprot:COSAG01_NODE_28983_length_648_cov_0.819672_2_plen_56_part_00
MVLVRVEVVVANIQRAARGWLGTNPYLNHLWISVHSLWFVSTMGASNVSSVCTAR